MVIWYRPTAVRRGYSRMCVGDIPPKQYALKPHTGPDATRAARRAPDLAVAATTIDGSGDTPEQLYFLRTGHIYIHRAR